ncbi:type IV secretory system conjugative DNA transfer family protein [Paracoccus albus]|uniref:type IV secretory system conjugative DNA transfer family protein n=1 Tax=Paracoccus albus TaxID=3017784 RepID=UPI0022F0B650|nr:type IV secretory system conjugative DNA transfer family protein [Paracoccus albus]WBU62209.1 type IV secretory system conjugative DNA transfer family protein [Paracoccus albus]
MTRTLVLLPFGMLGGAFIGLMLGAFWVTRRLGSPIQDTDLLLLVHSIPSWSMMTQEPWRTGYLFGLYGAGIMAVFVALLAIGPQLTGYGTAHFQGPAEIKRNGLLKKVGNGLVFGKIPRAGMIGKIFKFRRFVSATYDKFPHCLVVAPTRAGKGVGYVIPNTLLFPGSCVILDVKGEIFEATSRHRQSEGDEIFYFAPFDFEHPSHRYNPLERIAALKNTDQQFTELSKLSTYFLTTSEKGGATDFIVGARELFVAGGMLAIERGKPTIGEITRVLFGGADKSEEYKLRAAEARHAQTKDIFTDFSGYADRTLSSYVSVLKGAGLGLWVNPTVDRVTSGNDFSWQNVRMKPQTVYIVVNSDDIITLAPLMRLLFGELIATLRASLPNPKTEPWPVQIILDEFDQLGTMPIVVQSLKQLAGHGGRVSIITQSIPGLDKHYGENDRMSIESAAGIKAFISPNEKKTAGEVSEALGKTTRLSVSDSLSSDGRGLLRRSVSRRNEERPLMSVDEVRKLNAAKIILIPERQNPILADRIEYFKDPHFSPIMAAQSGPLPYPDERHQIRSMRVEIEKLQSEVAQFRPLPYAPPPPGNTAKALIAEVEAAQPAMTDDEAREALRPSDMEVIKKASDFRKKMKAKVPGG